MRSVLLRAVLLFAASALLTALALPAAAQTSGRLRDIAVSDSIGTLANEAYRSARYADAGPLYEASVLGSLAAGTPSLWYNAACSYALAADTVRAVMALTRAVETGWDDVALTLRDTDLTSIHGHPAWDGLVARTRGNDEARRVHQSDPDRVRIVTEDIARFWAAYDAAAQDTARAA
ncbi:MAG TPA: hypothetical protein VK610_02330, partial [Rhodothermales bacterium]|nr:hypothetical protein [Rhodothermales bacterium]